MTNEPTERRDGLVIPWGWASLILAIVAISALGTLAVIAKKQSADSLSTIALALAVLSFAAQLIITLAQGYNSVLQVAQADRVNVDTRASLVEIRATANSLLVNQRDQFSEVLRAALKSAIPAAVEDVAEIDDEDGVAADRDSNRQLEERLYYRLNQQLYNPRKPSVDQFAISEPSPLYDQLRTYPTSEARGRELAAILNDMSPSESAIFGRNSSLIRSRAEQGKDPWVTLTDTHGINTKLQERGLVTLEKIGKNSEGKDRFRLKLTDLGIELASLFLGSPPSPDWLPRVLNN